LLVTFIALIGISAIIITYAFLKIENQNLKFWVIIIPILVIFIVLPFYKKSFDTVTNIAYIYKIQQNAADPIKLTGISKIADLNAKLNHNGFTKYSKNESYELYYSVTKDDIRKTFPKYIIEIVVILTDQANDFYL